MGTRTPVEMTKRFATTVNGLAEAWQFVMSRIDDVGPDPSIRIEPVWTISIDDRDSEAPRHFSVVVEGMVEEVAQ